jgi:hypothetical protein
MAYHAMGVIEGFTKGELRWGSLLRGRRYGRGIRLRSKTAFEPEESDRQQYGYPTDEQCPFGLQHDAPHI